MEGTVQTNQEPTVRTAQSRGYRISYEDVGDGAPILLITGLTGSAEQMREDGYMAIILKHPMTWRE
jgi:pimeloyl-ACP methyl ester carboxylesterase